MANKMIIGIDGRPLIGTRTGVGQYTAQLIKAISDLDNHDGLRIFTGSTWLNYVPASDIKRKQHNVLATVSKAINWFGDYPGLLKTRLKSKLDKYYFNRGLKTIGPSILHGTNFHFYFSDVPTLVNIHDISCFRHPEMHPESRVRWHQEILPKTIEHSTKIVCESEYTRSEIVDYFGVNERDIVVTHIGVDDIFNPTPGPDDPAILKSYALEHGSYILSVGTLEPRKNLQTAIQAYAMLDEGVRNRTSLVLVGIKGWKDSALHNLIERYNAKGQIRILGYVPQEHLPVLYRNSAMFLYPSFYEGFGIPPLEAMTCGTPVIASNATSLPEVVGDAGILLDPFDTDSWFEAIKLLLEDRSVAKEYRKKGLAQSKKFSWKYCAEQTVRAYREVISSL